MKLLISARACSSTGGSENYFAWSAIQALSKDHDLWVLTDPRNRPDLEKAKQEGLVASNVDFTFVGGPVTPWHKKALVTRFQDWRDYYRFSVASLTAALDLHQRIGFDLAHHVTIATWRLPSPLWKLGIPFVFGPVGGNEIFPLKLFPTLSYQAAGFELLRKISNIVSRLAPQVRACIQNASQAVAADLETFELIKAIRGSDTGASLLNPAFYSSQKVSEFLQFLDGKRSDGHLQIFAGGNLEGRKGVALALLALACVKKMGVQFRYRVGGGGPEQSYLKCLAHRLDLKNEVIFDDALSGDAYREELGATHIFLLPSLRESAGLTMMEAMLAGCVPIVADCGGPRHIVTADCGYRIPISDRREFVRLIAERILELDRDRDMIKRKGHAAADRIVAEFNEQHYRTTINEIYSRAVAHHKQRI